MNTKPSFHIGDRVVFKMAGAPVRGVIVEDRGAVGTRGRRLYKVHVRKLDGSLELPETEIRRTK